MNTTKIFTAIAIALLITARVNAQTVSKEGKSSQKPETFAANGVCGMCKDRIEKGLKMEGNSKAEWDQKTNLTAEDAKTILYNFNCAYFGITLYP
jgi:hypothetical protein